MATEQIYETYSEERQKNADQIVEIIDVPEDDHEKKLPEPEELVVVRVPDLDQPDD